MAQLSYQNSVQAFKNWAEQNKIVPTEFNEYDLNQERRVKNTIYFISPIMGFLYLVFFSGIFFGELNPLGAIIWTMWNLLPIMFSILNEHKRYIAKHIGLFLERHDYANLNPEFRVKSAYAYTQNKQTIVLLGITMFFISLSYQAINMFFPAIVIGLLLTVAGMYVAYKMANNELMFIKVPEGTAIIIVRGGQMQKVVMAYRGRYLDGNNKVVPNLSAVPDIPGTKTFLQKIVALLSPGGLRFMGLPVDEPYEYDFKEKIIEPIEEQTNRKRFTIKTVITKKKTIPLGIQTMHLWVVKAETKEKPTVEIQFVIYYYIQDPVKFAFKSNDVYAALQGTLDPFLRQIVAKTKIASLFENREKIKQTVQDILKENENALGKLDEEYGIVISNIEIWNVDPTSQITVDALEAPWRAAQDKKRIGIEAQAEGARIKTVYEQINEIPNGPELFAQEVIRELGQSGNGTFFFPTSLVESFTKMIRNGGK